MTIGLAHGGRRTGGRVTTRRDAPARRADPPVRALRIARTPGTAAARVSANLTARAVRVGHACRLAQALAHVGNAGHAGIADRPTGVPRPERIARRLADTAAQARRQPGRTVREANVRRSFAGRLLGAASAARRDPGLAGADATITVLRDGALEVRAARRADERLADTVAGALGPLSARGPGPFTAGKRHAEPSDGVAARTVAALEIVATRRPTRACVGIASRPRRTGRVRGTARRRPPPARAPGRPSRGASTEIGLVCADVRIARAIFATPGAPRRRRAAIAAATARNHRDGRPQCERSRRGRRSSPVRHVPQLMLNGSRRV